MYRTHFVLLGCSHAPRIKKYEPRIISSFNGKVLGAQALDTIMTEKDFATVLTGYKSTKVKSLLKRPNTSFLKIENFKDCGMNQVILEALEHGPESESVCILHSDIWIENFNYDMSENFVLWAKNMQPDEVGLKDNHGVLERFSYAESKKWAKIINFDYQSSILLKTVLNETKHRWYIDTEVYNIILDSGIFFNTHEVQGFFKEFDCKNDYIDSK